MATEWKALLVDGNTQSSKTATCFRLLSQKISHENTLIIYITQANNKTSAQQSISRAMIDPYLSKIIPNKNFVRSSNLDDKIEKGHCMIVDFWNSRCTNKIQQFVMDTREVWGEIIIVIDEADEGGVKGMTMRLCFVKKINDISLCSIKLVFVTATIANLSKSLAEIAIGESPELVDSDIISDVLNTKCVEHYMVKPDENLYLGPNDLKPQWRKLEFPKQTANMTEDEYTLIKDTVMLESLTHLPDEKKHLCLIVQSYKKEDHTRLADKITETGFNVTIVLNSENDKDYSVRYIDNDGKVNYWNIPYKLIEKNADDDRLSSFYLNGKYVESGINSRTDLSLSHILKAALFYPEEDLIMDGDFKKVYAIFNFIMNMPPKKRRPSNYPQKPRVAIIAGNLAGRGLSIQNPMIDFVCTSACFVDSKNTSQCGAQDIQRLGRACGLLKKKFKDPIIIATENIMMDAIANQELLAFKALSINDGDKIALKDLVTKKEWEAMKKKVKGDFPKKKKPIILGKQSVILFEIYYKILSNNGTRSFSREDIINHPIAGRMWTINHLRNHHELIGANYIEGDVDKGFVVTQLGKEQFKKYE